MPRLIRLGNEAVVVAVGQAAAALGSIAIVFFLTHRMSPSAFGRFGLGLAFAALIQGPFSCLAQAVLRYFGSAAEAGETQSIARATIRLAWGGSVICATLGLVTVIVTTVLGLNRWAMLTLLAAGFAIASGWASVFDYTQNAMRRRVVVALHQGATPALRIVFAACLVAWLGPTSEAALAGFLIASVLILGSQVWCFRKSKSQTDSKSICDADSRRWRLLLLQYSVPFGTWFVFGNLQVYSDRWALECFGTEREVGLYSALYQVGYSPMVLMAGLLTQLMLPVLFNRSGDTSDPARLASAQRLTVQLVGLTAAICGVLVFIAYLFHDAILSFIAAESYQSVSSLLPWMVFSGGVFAVSQATTCLYLVTARSDRLIAPKIGTAIVGICISFVAARFGDMATLVMCSSIHAVVFSVCVIFMHTRDCRRQVETG